MVKRFLATVSTLLLALLCATPALAQSRGSIDMYRLYNSWTGEHLYTSSASERDDLRGYGWTYEGIGWVAPESSDTPVYRLYNPYTGDHHYTVSRSEYAACGAAGWSQEGVGWYSDDSERVPLYREFNPYETIGTHNYTTSLSEHQNLVGIGWRDEGIAWYGIEGGRSDVLPDQGGSGGSSDAGSNTGQSDVVYITSSGKGTRYHSTPTCSGLRSAKGVVSLSLWDAISQGYSPCKLCH